MPNGLRHATATPTTPVAPSLTLRQAITAFIDQQDAVGHTHATQVSYTKVLNMLERYLASHH